MSTLKRTLAAVSVPALLAISLSACGGGDGGASSAPKDASTTDFCNAFAGFKDLVSGTPSASDVKDLSKKLADVGTPSGISSSERNGFEVFVKVASKASSDTNLDHLGDGVSKSDEADVEAFVTYGVKTCPSALGGVVPSDGAS